MTPAGLGRLLALVLAVAGLVFLGGPAQADDPGTITKYDSDYTVEGDGDVIVVESITVKFPDPRHGIFRTFAPQPIEPSPPLPDRDSVTVTLDSKDVPLTITSTDNGFRVTIGDPQVTITGTHVYRIGYTVRDAVNDSGDEFTEFFWDTIGEDWELRILSSRLTVHLPEVAQFAGSCGIGFGESEECGGGGTDTTTFKTGALEPGTPVSVRVDYGDAAPDSAADPIDGGLSWLFGSFVSFVFPIFGLFGFLAL